MKKIFKCAAALVIISALFVFAGCADFSFNPTGDWKYVSDNLYADDKLISSATEENSPYTMTYHFDKDGTGYIAVAGTKTHEFTYSYDGKLHIHMQDIEKKMQAMDVDYELSSGNEMFANTIVQTRVEEEKDEDGHVTVYREEITLQR